MRANCCKTAQAIASKRPLDEAELEECARLDDALAQAHSILKSSVRRIMLARINRRSRKRCKE